MLHINKGKGSIQSQKSIKNKTYPYCKMKPKEKNQLLEENNRTTESLICNNNKTQQTQLFYIQPPPPPPPPSHKNIYSKSNHKHKVINKRKINKATNK